MIDVENVVGRTADNRWERLSIGDVFERNSWSQPDKEAIVGWDGAYADPAYARVTYRVADELCNRLANGILAAGLERGDRVLLICENSVEAFLTKIAIAKAGLVVIPINPALAPEVITSLLERCTPKFAMVDAELHSAAAPSLEAAGIAVDVTIPIGGDAVEGSLTWSEFVAQHPATEPEVTVHADDIWQILFTSGTTAMPKGVMQSHAYAHFAAFSFALSLTRGLDHENDLRMCCFLPSIYHVTDLVFTLPAFLSGGTLILGRRPDPVGGAAAVTRERATAFYGGSPQMLRAFAETVATNSINYDASTVTAIVFGWANIGQGLSTLLRKICHPEINLFEIFGQTESIACHRFHLDEFPEKYARNAPDVNYVGLPSPSLASAVVDLEGNDLRDQPGVPGEAVYRSPAITAGYYLDEPATRDAFRGGWFHSGDVCAYDEQGLRIMRDRIKDIVKSGGENVSSLRVEAVLQSHPAIARAAVVGLAHERWGEAVTAFVVLTPGEAFEESAVLDFARTRLSRFERPKSLVVVPDLPQTVGGKILKYRLRQDHAAHYTHDRDSAAADR